MDTVGAYAENNAWAWRHLLAARVEESDVHQGFNVLKTAVPMETRVNLTRASGEIPEQVSAHLDGPGRVYLEDPFGELPLLEGFKRSAWPVMVRRGPAPIPDPGIDVVAVDDEKTLFAAERLIVDGFPMRSRQPATPQCVLPVSLLETEEWCVWSALDRGIPVAACLTFDHGGVVGVYWLVTDPEHRSRGIARGMMSAVLGRYRGTDVVLVSTDEGRSLYDSLGFVEVSRGSLYTRNNVS